MVSLVGGSMAKRVLLVRGGSLGRNTGLGAAHHNLVDMLEACLLYTSPSPRDEL